MVSKSVLFLLGAPAAPCFTHKCLAAKWLKLKASSHEEDRAREHFRRSAWPRPAEAPGLRELQFGLRGECLGQRNEAPYRSWQFSPAPGASLQPAQHGPFNCFHIQSAGPRLTLDVLSPFSTAPLPEHGEEGASHSSVTPTYLNPIHEETRFL